MKAMRSAILPIALKPSQLPGIGSKMTALDALDNCNLAMMLLSNVRFHSNSAHTARLC